MAATYPLEFGKYGLKRDPRGLHVVATYKGRDMLGVVKACRWERGFTMLTVHYLCGEPWPIEPAANFVRALDRTPSPEA